LNDHSSTYSFIRTLTIEDRVYELYRFNCGHYRILRTTGMHPSIFNCDNGFDEHDFDNFCRDLDEELFLDAPYPVSDFYEDLKGINSKNGIQADGTFTFRLLEFGRVRLVRLQKLGAEHLLKVTARPLDEASATLQAAFELGFAAGQYATEKHSGEYFWAGVEACEWRKEGQPKATAERCRQGHRTRQAILKAAHEIYRDHPTLARNDMATARRAIQKLSLPGLKKDDGRPLSIDAITKHLRDARKRNTEKS
jgi:hypothetical protein